MSIIKCPECGKEISSTVKTCPNCGYKIKKYLRTNGQDKKVLSSEMQKEDKPKLSKKLFLFILLSLVILVIVLVIILFPKHDWIDADCTNPKTCSICGKERGEPLGHDYADATCSEPQICIKCGESQGSPLGHTYGEYTVTAEPTCASPGKKTATCSVCRNIDTQNIPLLSHTAGEWIVLTEPTFAEDGINIQYCQICGQEISKKNTSLPEAEKESLYKEACEKFTYSDYARDFDAVNGKYCKSYGEVVQVIPYDDGKTFDLRINITKGGSFVTYWTDDIWVIFTKPEGAQNVLEDDLVTFYGVASGTYTYETVNGGTRTVPLIYASYVDIGSNNTGTKKQSVQTPPPETTPDGAINTSGFSFAADVFCQEEQDLYVTFAGVDDPASSLQSNYIGVKFLITNNNSSDVTLLLRGFTINDCSFETSGGAAAIAAGAKSFLTCNVKKDALSEYNITSIDKVSGYLWISDIGYTSRFTINTR